MNPLENGSERMRQKDIDATFEEAHRQRVEKLNDEVDRLKANDQLTSPLEPAPDKALLSEIDDVERGALHEHSSDELKTVEDLVASDRAFLAEEQGAQLSAVNNEEADRSSKTLADLEQPNQGLVADEDRLTLEALEKEREQLSGEAQEKD